MCDDCRARRGALLTGQLASRERSWGKHRRPSKLFPLTADMTMIEVPTALRAKLDALIAEGGRGTTLADVLQQLLDEHDSIRTRQMLAFDAQL
ncbi:hypothetical protein B0I32_14317 [Nonomuraea fuscirosea]|uniref:Uncharacterized protein n=1 Tax=Nonomuraea fuscirosea TaxID=1291556 RepID=A0A2T0LT28_9ACTN|nr:hypothetical protein B0I32_14317 [Nonomuraea fuscirosea]